MQGCNDCAFDYEGNLWITAPAGDIAPAEYTRSMQVSAWILFDIFLRQKYPALFFHKLWNL